MTKQEEVQFKVIALQTSLGDIVRAKEVFSWLIEDSVNIEVARALVVAQRSVQGVVSGQ